MHRKRIIFSSFAVGYVRRLQNLDHGSSSSESEQSFGSSGIYSDESESDFCSNSDSDSETSDQNADKEMSDSDMEAELRSSRDKPATGVCLHNEADKRATDRSFGLLPRVDDECGLSAKRPNNHINTAESMFVAEESNGHVDKLMDQCTKVGSIPVEFDAEGNLKIVPQVLDYHYRPEEFLSFSLFEFVLTTQRVPINSNSADTQSSSDSNESVSSSDQEETPRKRGRKPNKQFRFQQQHPLSKSHVVTIMPKHCIPHFIARVPNYPGDRPNPTTKTWEAQAQEFAAFALVVYKPWSGPDGLPGPITWNAFCDYVDALSASQTLIDRTRLAYITIAAHGLKFSHAASKVLKWFRASNATRWLDMQPQHRPKAWMFGDETEAEKNLPHKGTQQQAELAMNELLYKTVFASPHEKHKESLIEHVLSVVNETFNIECEDPQEGASFNSGGALPGSFPNITERLNCFSVDQVTVVNDHNRLSDSERLQEAEQKAKSSRQRKTGIKQGRAAQRREPPSPSEPVQWSPQQKKIIDRVSRYIDSVVRWRDTGCKPSERPQGVTLLIFGAPGVGKTAVLKKLTKMCQEAALPLLCAAFTGVAAGSMMDAKTLHSQYIIPVLYINLRTEHDRSK